MTNIDRRTSLRPLNVCLAAYIPPFDALALVSVGELLPEMRGLLLGSREWELGRIDLDDCSIIKMWARRARWLSSSSSLCRVSLSNSYKAHENCAS